MTTIRYCEDTWTEIQQRWENGESAGQIAKTPGMPSKVAINKRVKREGWARLSVRLPVGTTGNTVVIPVDLEPRRRAALEALALGGNLKDAARKACVSESTFREWRRDPEYSALCEAAVTGLKLEMLGYVKQGAARDPKNAQWMLQHHPILRAEFGQSRNTVTGNTFNVLAHVKTGITRGIPADEDDESLDTPVLIEGD